MTLAVGPVLRALARSKIGAILMALQIAFTLAVVVNAWTIIADRLRLMDRPSGLVEEEQFHLTLSGYTPNFDARTATNADLTLLRALPGIVDATTVNTVPFSQSGWSMGLQTEAGADRDAVPVAVYMVDDHGVDTFGLELLAGRNFRPEDVRERTAGATDWPPTVILSAAAAKALWPDASPLEVVGRTVFIAREEPMIVVGVIALLQSPWPSASNVDHTMLVPDKTIWNRVRYLVRTEAGRLDETMPRAEEALAQANPQRIVRAPQSMIETRAYGYWLDSGLSLILATIMAALLLVTSFGIVGLTSFSVRRRTKQIGTRRALGARKADILRDFLVEVSLISALGLLLGTALAVAFNVALVQTLQMPKLDWPVVLLGAIALWLLGLLAVLGPAHRATQVPPSVATRTV